MEGMKVEGRKGGESVSVWRAVSNRTVGYIVLHRASAMTIKALHSIAGRSHAPYKDEPLTAQHEWGEEGALHALGSFVYQHCGEADALLGCETS
jgi:hypothetical protein